MGNNYKFIVRIMRCVMVITAGWLVMTACSNADFSDMDANKESDDNVSMTNKNATSDDLERDERSISPVNVTGMYLACLPLQRDDNGLSIYCRVEKDRRDIDLTMVAKEWSWRVPKEKSFAPPIIIESSQSSEWDVRYQFDGSQDITTENLAKSIVVLRLIKPDGNILFVTSFYEDAVMAATTKTSLPESPLMPPLMPPPMPPLLPPLMPPI